MPGSNGSDGQGAGDKGASPSGTITLEIDGEQKSLTPEEVTNLVKGQAEVTKKAQQAAAILNAAQRYGVSVEDYLSNAEASFAVTGDLIERGIIDKQGKLVEKPGKTDPPPVIPPKLTPGAQVAPEDKVAQIVAKALEPLVGKLEGLERDTGNIMRIDLERQLTQAHPNLDSDDVSRIFGIASADRKRGLREVAKDYAETKAGKEAEMEKKFAEKYGVNVDEFNKNRLLEQDPGGAAGALVKGKDIVFGVRAKRTGKKDGFTTPLDATRAFFNRQLGGR